MSLRDTDERENQGTDETKGMWEQIDEVLQDVVLPPPPRDPGDFDEPSGNELRAANLLERSVEPIACSAQSQVAYAAEILHHASIVDEEGTAEHRHQAVAALKAGRFLREITVSKLEATMRRFDGMRELSAQRSEAEEMLDRIEVDRRENPDYVPDDSPPVSTEAEIEAERCEIRELEEAVAHWEAVRDGIDALVARVRTLNPRAALAFDREERTGSVT